MIRLIVFAVAGIALLAVGFLIGLQYQPPGAPSTPALETAGLRPQYRSGPFEIGIEVIPATPRVGENRVRVVLQTQGGEPVRGATIQAVAEMPAMGAMPAMRAPAEMREIKPGLYEGSFNLPMEGSWPLTLIIDKSGLGRARLTLDMATGRPGLRLSSGATPLEPVSGAALEESPPGTVTLDSQRRQLIGVKTGEAQVSDLTRTIRAVGQVTYDETLLADVTLKFDAWIGELCVDYLGASVKKGQKLFTVYGPQLLAVQQEYLEIKRRAGRSEATGALLAAARKRLSLWDMTPGEIEALAHRGVPYDYMPIHAPISGTVVTKNVVEGTAQKAGVTLMRIADLSRVWVEAYVYEAELPLVRLAMPVTVVLPYLPGRTFEGTVDYVYPYLNGRSRTGRIRIVLDNPGGVLKPDMYAEVKLEADLGQRLTVPEEAVIIAGETRIVFEDLGGGRLAPRIVETGQRAAGRIEILSGLEPGDQVVTSGNFLIASESRLKAGIKQW
ncbi:MAG: hypothetical protein Kow0060_24070 [Methylohalobius crimeensis]